MYTLSVSCILACLLLMACSDPNSLSAGHWTVVPSQGFTPRSHVASTVIDGKIYVTGGLRDTNGRGYFPCNVLDVYDPLTNSWSTPQTSGFFAPRHNHVANVVNSKIYVIGGVSVNDTNQMVQIFDPLLNEWSTPQTTGHFMPDGEHVSCVINNKIYVFGGEQTGIPDAQYTVQVFDPISNRWSSIDSFSIFFLPPASYISASAFEDNVFCFYQAMNQIQIKKYDPLQKIWTTIDTSEVISSQDNYGCYLINNKMYVLYREMVNYLESYLSVRIFNPETGVWENTKYRNERFSPVISNVVNGKIYSLTSTGEIMVFTP